MTKKNFFTCDNPIMFDWENEKCRCIPIPYKEDKMTEKRFKEIVSTQKVIDTVTNKEYDCLLDNDLFDLINNLAEENTRLKQEKQSKRKPKYIHQHIIRITYPYQTDVEDTEHMIKHIKSIIVNETDVEPTIEEYLL